MKDPIKEIAQGRPLKAVKIKIKFRDPKERKAKRAKRGSDSRK